MCPLFRKLIIVLLKVNFFVCCRCLKYLSTRGSLLEVNHCAVMGHSDIFLQRVDTQYAVILMVQGRAHPYLVLLCKKDESGLALSQGHSGASLCLLGPRDNLGSPPVSVLVFLLPVAEMCFGSREKVRNSEVGSEGSCPTFY